MELGYLAVGVALLVLVSVDLLWTSLWVDGGAGPLSDRLTKWIWRLLLQLNSRLESRVASIAGPAMLVLTLSMWVALFWAGWTFVFAAGDPAVVDTNSGTPINLTDLLYFSAYVVFTLGMGDIVPKDGFWQVVTTLATGNGVLFVTLGVSYVLSVVDAVSNKRTFAAEVSDLGSDGVAFALAGWDGEDFHELDPILGPISTRLNRLTEQHNAYPILHYYHTQNPKRAAAPSTAVLDEAVTLLQHGVEEDCRPNEALLHTTRSSITGFLGTLTGTFAKRATEPPDPPDLDRLAEAGVPTRDHEEFDDAVETLETHRMMVRSMVESDGWGWLPHGEEGWR